jgi:ADP-dependent NAD(P)H-hydrate dehydratase / NAD(P)H-hydrate epimerase
MVEGMPMDQPAPCRNTPDLWRDAMADAGLDAHKYQRGSVLVWSGPPLATGASRLAAIAALRAGAGLVTLAGQRAALMVHAAHVTAIMLRQADGADGLAELLADARYTSLVLGPAMGVGAAARELVSTAMRAGRPCVLDADALTSFAGEPSALAARIAENSAPVVVTPHEGEFARLMGERSGARLDRGRAAAHALGATVVLKGPATVIAAADGRTAIDNNGPPWLATAGSGDVLTGIIGGLMAQGMAGFEAACASVWIHGSAARIAGQGMIADDLALAVSKARHGWKEEP